MTDRSGAAPRADRGEGRERPDALAYWYLQEATPLDTDRIAGLPEAAPEEPRMASGWWLLPAVLLSVPVWIALGRLVFGQG